MLANPVSILITDDDWGFRETLKSVFEPQGLRTLTAGDGEEALRILQGENVHLVLLDMHMPRLTGLETLRRVKQFKSRLPCILMSANADERLVQEAMLEHAYAVLSKPVSQRKITSVVHFALREAYDWAADRPFELGQRSDDLPPHSPKPDGHH